MSVKQIRRCTGILILSLLAVSVFAPVFTLSASEEYIEDLSSIKYRSDAFKLSVIGKDEAETLKEPPLAVYKDEDFNYVVSFGYADGNIRPDQFESANSSTYMLERNGSSQDTKQGNQQIKPEKPSSTSGLKKEEKAIEIGVIQNLH